MVKQATVQDIPAIGSLMAALWPHHSAGEMEKEAAEILSDPEAALFLAEENAGFAHCGLRHDYVEGTQSHPVGYLEGIYVAEKYRGRGYARKLLSACENWAKEKGCREFASDCELDNTQSLKFHMKLGFSEANRIICFTKSL